MRPKFKCPDQHACTKWKKGRIRHRTAAVGRAREEEIDVERHSLVDKRALFSIAERITGTHGTKEFGATEGGTGASPRGSIRRQNTKVHDTKAKNTQKDAS